MSRRQMTDDGRQNTGCGFAAPAQKPAQSADNNLSSVFCRQSSESGFTLIEMIVVIVITGIIAAIVAVFIRAPVQGYMDSARRAGLGDTADTALRRMARDLRLALPNSVRVNTSGSGANTIYYLDFLSTSSGGRYRATGTGSVYCASAAPANYDALLFTVADTCFEIFGPQIQFQDKDQVVIYNLGIPGADAYEGNTAASHVRREYAGTTAAPVSFVSLTSTNPFPFESPSQRFHVVREQVRYICDPLTGNLTRYRWSAGNIVSPSPATPSGAHVSSALLATNVSACNFTYDPNVVAQRSGLVTMQLTLTQDGESVALYNAAHISNAP